MIMLKDLLTCLYLAGDQGDEYPDKLVCPSADEDGNILIKRC